MTLTDDAIQKATDTANKLALLASYDISDEQRKFLEATDRAYDMACALNSYQEQCAVLSEQVESRKAEVTLACLAANDENGKPRASNETQRRAMLDLALADDEGYQETLRQHLELRHRLANCQAEIEMHGREATLARLSMEYKTACLRLLAGG